MSAPVTVTQVVDTDAYCIQVRLDPEQVLLPLAQALLGNHEKLMLIRHLPTDHPARQQAHAELLRILADVFTVTLTPGQAEALGGDLYEATTKPEQCVHCENFSVTTVDGIELCHGHARAYDPQR